MKKVSKDGNRCTVIEFEVRGLDQYGDAQEVEHYETEGEAKDAARKLFESGDYPAVVVEKHTSCYPAHLFDNPSIYKRLMTMGNRDALTEGGWL